MGMKTKGVAFNLADPDQKELYEWAMDRTNFSAYIKRLIQADRDRRMKPPPIKSADGGIRIKL